MLTILSWCWIGFGVWWMLRPNGAKKRMQKKFMRTTRWLLFVVLFAVGGLLFAAGREIEGVLSWLLPLVGVIALFKGLVLVRGKAAEKVIGWWAEQPSWVYRLSGALALACGLGLRWLNSGPDVS